MDKKTVSIAVPCYNEEGNVEELYRRVNEVMSTLPDYEYEFVFIDNKSTDRTRNILRDLARNDKRVKVILNQGNFGPGPSSAHGLIACEGDAVIGMACDLQDPPELIPRFVEAWEAGSKIVMARHPESDEHGPIKFFRNCYYAIIEKLAGTKGFDHASGYGLYDKSIIEVLRESGDPCPNYRLTFMRYGYQPTFIDFKKPGRLSGKSSYSFISYLGVALESAVVVSRRPVHIIAASGALSSIIFALVLIAMLILGLVMGDILFWVFFGVSLICLGLSLVVLALGVVGAYAALGFEWTRSSPLVIEDERLNWDEQDGALS